MAGQEAVVQVPADSTGKKIRNLVFKDVVQPDGTVADVYVQTTSIVDASTGQPVDLDDNEWKYAMLERLDTIASLLTQMLADDVKYPFADDGDPEQDETVSDISDIEGI